MQLPTKKPSTVTKNVDRLAQQSSNYNPADRKVSYLVHEDRKQAVQAAISLPSQTK